jgi:hypothetical protein
MAVPADRAAADVLRDYQGGDRGQRPRIRAAGDPDTHIALPGRRQPAHAAVGDGPHDKRDRPPRRHADIIREQLDGTTGR